MAEPYTYNPAGRSILDDWLNAEPGDEQSALKHQTRLLIADLESQLVEVRKDARETICGARRILADDALSHEAKVKKLKLHFSTARALLLVWEPATPAVCRALEAAVEAYKEPGECDEDD